MGLVKPAASGARTVASRAAGGPRIVTAPAGTGPRLLKAALAAAAIGAASAAAAAPGVEPASASRPTPTPTPTPTPLPLPSLRAGEVFPDPMRPSGLSAPGVAAAGRAAPRPQVEARPARLQSVLLGSAGARAAVIDGRLLAVGDRLGEARLLGLSERSAVLVGPQGQTTTLLLIPGVDKRDLATLPRPAPATPPEPASVPSRRPARPPAWRATETLP